MLFLVKIYYFVEISKYAEVCNSLCESFGPEVENLIYSLSKGSNALFWIFSSKNKKSNAEEAYEKLFNMKNGSFVLSAQDVLKKITDLPKEDINHATEEVIKNKSEFKDAIIKLNNNLFTDYGLISVFKKYFDEYESILNNFNLLRKMANESIEEIKTAANDLLANELVISLRGIPVDELARDKSGIKTKYLKDAGYESLADVFGASVMQINSIYGISLDKAYTIKTKCENYAKKLNRELKIKLSVDNKSKSATKVVEAIYFYIKEKNFIKKIEDLNANYENDLKNSLAKLNSIGNGVKWIFLTDFEMNDIKNSFKFVENILVSQYIPLVNEINQKFKVKKKNSNEADIAWNDFAENSINYYNVIEEVCPGILGNDDSIYGLPEELARKIQDECFFPDGLLCTLRKYQEWGVKYILHQEKVLLGDEMGLGKTIQAIATMVSLKNTGATHFMVICPASIVTNWCREITKHSKLKAIKIHGKNKTAALNSWLKIGGVAVTNYESTNNINLEENFKFALLIVDEAHYIKNALARRSINTTSLSAHANRLLFMTGTALENNVDEMISLIDILRPSIANSIKKYAFMSSAPQFRAKIAPVYYRRKRDDVLTELPDKIESREWCNLNYEEEEIYEEAVLNHNFSEVRRVSWNIDDLNKSCKAVRLKEIVEEAEAEGRKVLVFSFFLDTLAKIHEFLKGKCLNPINGSVNINRRQEIIDEFEQAPAGNVLLAQITTGGLGLNIQAASVVVFCEPQLKPSIENQAISRAYRMGQTRKVLVYRLLCENTVDEKLMNTLEEKQKIFDAFADKSVAAQENLKIDDKTFGDIIKEEIERINQKRGVPSEASLDIKIEQEQSKVSNLKMYKYTPLVVQEQGKEYYQKIMQMSYDELVQYLINKYGPAKFDYFTNESCTAKNKNVTRTSEGLVCHHIDEDKAINLSTVEYAAQNPFEYQKANRLVYCNLLEHFLLHILIAEEPKNINANQNEIQGIGGAICFICKQLNDIYNGYKYDQQWFINIACKVKNDYDSYIMMLKRLWNLVQNNKILSNFVTKEDLAVGFSKVLYQQILNELQ